MKNLKIITLAVTSLVVSTITWSAGQTSTNFAIPRDTINAGVANMSSTNFVLSASVGDAVAGGTIVSVSFQLSSGFRGTVNAPPAVLNLLSVFSRKLHSGLPFDLIVNDQPLTGTITVEPRAIGVGYMVVFRFDNAITFEGTATALDAALNSAATVTLTRAGNDVIATLTNVADNKRLRITLTGVNNSATPIERSLGFLVGDVTSSRSVNAADISAVKANLGKLVNNAGGIGVAKFDLNADGSITQADVSAAKARSGLAIP